MAYFSQEEHFPNDEQWDDAVNYIKTTRPALKVEYRIEAKALQVFTVSHHLMLAAEKLPRNGNWKPFFMESSMLLFPMIELIGYAVLGHGNSSQSLGGGIDWLCDPLVLPTPKNKEDLQKDTTRVGSLGKFMPNTVKSGPTVQELFHLRNYLLHGSKKQDAKLLCIGKLQKSMSYELPQAIIKQTRVGLLTYWKQLKNTHAKYLPEWAKRLAKAEIYPLRIMGSTIYEKGLIDPDIVNSLENN